VCIPKPYGEWSCSRNAAGVDTDRDDHHVIRSSDPGDDYLIALAAAERAALVSGDQHLLSLAALLPVFSPADLLGLLEKEQGTRGSPWPS
jgi:predicted nucleic acid-binding protein